MNLFRNLIFFNLLIFVTPFAINHVTRKHLCLFMKKSKSSDTFLYKPKTERQEKYSNILNNDHTKIIIAIGPAGTGKTLFACQKAIKLLKSEEINKIIITRPIVTIEEEIGFLPGNLIKKMDPWTRPIFDIFLEHFSRVEFDMMLSNGKIEICPLLFMRGRTFKNAFIIADEMQNSSPNQMKMLATRLGENSRLAITGDLNQSDILIENGLYDLINKINNLNVEIERKEKLSNITTSSDFLSEKKLIDVIEFYKEDIERSEVVKKIIEIYDFATDDINDLKNNEYIVVKENNISSKKNSTSSFTQTSQNSTNTIDAALIPSSHVTKHYTKFLDTMKNF